MRGTAIFAPVLLVLLGTGACRSRPVSVQGTGIAAGDALHGRLVPGRLSQGFTLEGVEGSVLDFDLVSDEASLAAPQVALLDPEGKAVDLMPYVRTAHGAATTRVRDVVLLRTGTYQVTVTPTVPSEPVYYRFHHRLDFPPMEGVRVSLSPGDEYPVYVSAPRGGQVTVIVTPLDGSDVAALFTAVKDPWGGRALDSSRRPAGALAATVTQGHDGSVFLNFAAPIPGRYTVLASARPGKGGTALISTRVAAPPTGPRAVWHPNRPAEDFGLPAGATAADPAAGR